MAALTVDANVSQLGGAGVKMTAPCSPSAATTWFAGGMVWSVVATGRVVKTVAGSTAAGRFMGFCSKRQYTTAADQLVEFYRGGLWVIPQPTAAVAATDIGKYIGFAAATTVYDSPADLALITLAAGDHVVGIVVSMDAATVTIDTTLGGLNAASPGLLL